MGVAPLGRTGDSSHQNAGRVNTSLLCQVSKDRVRAAGQGHQNEIKQKANCGAQGAQRRGRLCCGSAGNRVLPPRPDSLPQERPQTLSWTQVGPGRVCPAPVNCQSKPGKAAHGFPFQPSYSCDSTSFSPSIGTLSSASSIAVTQATKSPQIF